MANPNQYFLLADHIKLSLLERQRAISLNLEPTSQDGHISRSLDSLREGLESVIEERIRLQEAGDISSVTLRFASTAILTIYQSIQRTPGNREEPPETIQWFNSAIPWRPNRHRILHDYPSQRPLTLRRLRSSNRAAARYILLVFPEEIPPRINRTNRSLPKISTLFRCAIYSRRGWCSQCPLSVQRRSYVRPTRSIPSRQSADSRLPLAGTSWAGWGTRQIGWIDWQAEGAEYTDWRWVGWACSDAGWCWSEGG